MIANFCLVERTPAVLLRRYSIDDEEACYDRWHPYYDPGGYQCYGLGYQDQRKHPIKDGLMCYFFDLCTLFDYIFWIIVGLVILCCWCCGCCESDPNAAKLNDSDGDSGYSF